MNASLATWAPGPSLPILAGAVSLHAIAAGLKTLATVPNLTYKVDGSVVTESVAIPAVVRITERNIVEFRKFKRLHKDPAVAEQGKAGAMLLPQLTWYG